MNKQTTISRLETIIMTHTEASVITTLQVNASALELSDCEYALALQELISGMGWQ